MASPSTVELGELITRIDGVCGGRPCLRDTRFPVAQVAACFNDGMTAEEIDAEYGPLELAAIYAGIGYYLANKASIDAELEERARLSDALAREGPLNVPAESV